MYNIRKVTIEEKEVISKIWRACFTEDQSYIDTYLNYCFPYCKTYVLYLDGEGAVSSLSVIPSYISRGTEIYGGGYIYAVGTLPLFRGRGYAKILIEEVARICKNSGYSYLVVKPATETLFPYYEKLNFSIKLKSGLSVIKRSRFSPVSPLLYSTEPLTGKILYKLRNRALSSFFFLTIPKIVEYAVLECNSRKGGISTLIHKEGYSLATPVYYLAYPDEKMPDSVTILETNAKTNTERELITSHIFDSRPEVESIIYSTHPSFLEYSDSTIAYTELAISFKSENNSIIESRHFSLPLE